MNTNKANGMLFGGCSKKLMLSVIYQLTEMIPIRRMHLKRCDKEM